ncbi:MAG: ribonuclease Z [Flavobacteriales bacterium]|nr:ribonuclease Z [Flavobacteriales bacterium]
MALRRFDVIPLGTGAALPARGRHPSAQLLNVHEALYLIDCGEGTQERLRELGINFMRVGHVFISHMHGDHYLGLMGLLSTMHLLGRKTPLHVHGPPALREVVDVQLRASETWLRFPVEHRALTPANGILAWQDERVEVRLLALRHRIPCTGFVFREKPAPRPLRLDRLHLVPHFRRDAVKLGDDLVLADGSTMPNAELTLEPPPVRSYAYCSDTAYETALIPHLRGVDLLYHEATFTEQLAARAKETYHTTAAQAATLARDAGVGRLLLGHFSSRYKTVEPLLAEARAIFPATLPAQEGVSYTPGANEQA